MAQFSLKTEIGRSLPTKLIKSPYFECLQSVQYQPVVSNTTPPPLT